MKTRPESTVEEMNQALIRAWNSTIKPHDEVYHIGDFGFGTKSKLQKIFNQLNGIKHLIEGNHDPRAGCQNMHGWASVQKYLEFNYQKTKIVLFHFPIASWNKKAAGAIHIHGHSHGFVDPIGKRIDVGVDAVGYAPISLDEVMEIIANRPAE